MIENRIRKNIKRLKSRGVQSSTEAYRIYDLDIPEYPFMADIYASNIVIHDRRNDKIDENKTNLDELLEALKKIFPDIENIYLKRRKNQDRFQKYAKFSSRNKELFITEQDIQFKVNLSDYIDTGLFLDHRPLRKWVKKETNDKRVLNLFSYTCSISTAAAVGGATEVTSIDLSQKYLDWGKENFIQNNIPLDQHKFIAMDILDALPEITEVYDLIICDPPTFSNSKKMDNYFDVQKDHIFLINECLKKLSPNGKLYFSCNKRDFKLDDCFLNQDSYQLLNLTEKSIPADFNNKKIHQCYLFQKNK